MKLTLKSLLLSAILLVCLLTSPIGAQTGITLQIKRVATEASIPTLAPGQLCYAGDTQRTFIGTALSGNVLFAVPLQVQLAGVLQPTRNVLNFSGSGVSVSDDAVNGRTNIVISGGSGGTGTVTSVSLAAPSIFSVSGSPITSAGTITLSLATQSANLVFAGPGSGSAAAPTFRSLVPLDYPVFVGSGASHARGAVPDPGSTAGTTRYLREDGSWTTPPDTAGTGTVTSVAGSGGTTGLTFSGSPVTTSGTLTLGGTLALASGGTGATSANAGLNNLLPSQSGNSGKFLTTNGTNTSWATVSSGGSVPSGSDTQTLRYSGTTLTASSALLNDGSNISVLSGYFRAGGSLSSAVFTGNPGVYLGESGSNNTAHVIGIGGGTAGFDLLQNGTQTQLQQINTGGGGVNLLLFVQGGTVMTLGSSGVPIQPAGGYLASDGSTGITEDIVIGSVTLHVKDGLIVGHD